MTSQIIPTKTEVFFAPDEIIVSKTDIKGRITYANNVFCRIAGYNQRELLGAPHSVIRHPDMPRAVFKYLWDTILDGREIFAYVKNMNKQGHFYWVFAHVTPSRSLSGELVGFHSNRRIPKRAAIDAIAPLYESLLREEASHRNAKDGLDASYRKLVDFVTSQKVSYDELVLAL